MKTYFQIRIRKNFLQWSLVAFSALFTLGLNAQLSGTYTIGGTSPNYASISAAVSALNTSGISGAVTFNIRQGTYNERVSIGAITGSRPNRVITFQADPNNTSPVIVQYTNSSSTLNYVFRLNGTKNLAFKKLTVKANGTTYSRAFELRGVNDSISIDSCTIQVNKISTSSSGHISGLYEESGSTHRTSNISITNSTFEGGAYGIYAYGYSTSTWFQRNWKIVNNTLKDWHYMGISLANYFDTVSISRNEIIQRSSATISSYGIYTFRCYRSNIDANKVIMTSRNVTGGIYAQNLYGQSNLRSRIANNMISMTNTSSTGTRYGIYNNSSNYVDVVFNSIYNKQGSGYALYGRYGTSNVYRNNAIENSSTISSAYGQYFLGTSTRSNNCLWVPNATASNTTLGSNSKLKNPLFSSETDLHASGIDLNNAGISILGVTKDFDGQTRNTSTPDIGADEFTPPNVDAGISEIANYTVCASSNSMKVRLYNYGLNTLTSATINWTVKVGTGSPTTQTAYNWTGSLSSGKDTVVTIGNYTMTATNTYEIKAWTSSPNSTTDGNAQNDTASKSFSTSLNGIYTIGGSSPDYTTIQAAATDLKNKGVCGPVTFRIRAGSYNEAVTIDSAKGLSATNTVTFTKDPASSGNVVWYRFGEPLTFRHTRHISVENITLETRSSYNVVYFLGYNEHIKIKKCTIRGFNTSSSSASYALIYGPGNSANKADYVTIDSNRFVRGSSAIYLWGYTTSTGNRGVGNSITNNQYDSSGYYGFNFRYQDSITIGQNTIKDHPGQRTAYYGIYCPNSHNFTISQNKIELTSGVTTSVYGIWLSGGGGTSANHSKVENNYVLIDRGTYGIHHSQVNYVDYSYNTVRITGTNTGSYAGYFYYGLSYLKNNIFSNEADGYAIYARYNSHIPLCDNNNLYSNSATRFAYGQNAYRSTFAQWKSAMSRDQNSVSVNSYWRTPNGYIPNNGALNGAGSAITGITQDIDGKNRATTPDIGCVEFTPSTNDAGIAEVIENSICPGSSAVSVRLRNNGNNTLTQARVQWNVSVNGGTPVGQTAYNWSGSLSSYSDTVISLGNYTFVATNSYKITAYTDRANNTTDPVKGNDTASSNNLNPKMSGTYTVGGTSPDYTTLQAAVNALQTRGVCGAVVLNVRAGSYAGRTTFQNVPGASSANTITVQTDPSTTGRADLYNSSYPFLLSGTKHYIFKNLNLRVTGNSYVVYCNGNNEYITFDNDSLIGRTITSTSSGYSVFYDINSSSAIQKHFTIKNSVFMNGSYSIYLFGGATSGTFTQNNIEIENNKFLNFYYQGIYAYRCQGIKVVNNEISDANSYQAPYGVYLNYCDSNEISGNEVKLKAGYGISAYYNTGSSGTPGSNIYNNFVSFKDTSSTSFHMFGIYTYGGSYGQIAFNSVNIPKGSSSSSCIWGRYGSNYSVKNNNFVNKGTGYGQYYLTVGNISQLDYNNTYVNGTNFGYYGGNRTSIGAWRTATSRATNSLNVDPLYISLHDLHAQNTAIDGEGTPISGITQDIDGDNRNTSTPDIGADEFSLFARDAGVESIISGSVCPGNQSVRVRLRNYGTSTLTSTSIQWRVSTNGGTPVGQTNYSFSGSLASGKDTILSIGNFNFTSGNSYQIWANTSGVNSSSDQNTSNDSSTTGSITPALSGFYTVGSTGSNWSTIDSAITALETLGVCGPTTIYIKNGNYNEIVRFDSIPGTSANNTVRILGDTVNGKPTWRSTSVTLSLYNVKHVTFENLHLSATSGVRVVDFYNDNQHITFKNDSIVGRNINSTSTTYSTIYNTSSSTYQQDNIRFEDNVILNGSYALYWYGWGTTNNAEKGNAFLRNKILNAYFIALWVINQDSCTLDSNFIQNKTTNASSYAVNLQNASNSSVTRNTIHQMNGGFGIYLNNVDGSTTTRTPVANNFISVGGTGTSRAMDINSSDFLDVYHNSVNMYNSNSGSYCFYHNLGNSVNVKNNSFYASSNARVVYTRSNTQYIGDYNNMYTAGSVFGYYVGNRSTLAQWRSATSDDANSVSVNPNYTDTIDLHTTHASLNNAGTPVGVLTDIDGNTRSTTAPDIGADEFTSVPRDLDLVELTSAACAGSNPVKLKIRNSGTSTITSARIKWTLGINGGTPTAQTDLVYSGSLASQSDTVVTLGTINFSSSNRYDFHVYVDSVNGNLDQNNLNDTLKVDSAYTALTGVYTVGGTTPDFNSVSNAVSALYQRGVCGSVRFFIRPGTYTDRIYLNDSIDGASAINTVTFETDTNFTAKATLRRTGQIVYGANLSHVRVRNLNLETQSFTYVVQIVGKSSDIDVEGCNITGRNTTSTSTSYSTVYISSTPDGNDIRILNNEIKYGSNGVYVNAISSRRMWNVEVSGNTITDFSLYGAYFNNVDSIKVIGNTISNRVGRVSSQGISLNNLFTYTVSHNTLRMGKTDNYNVYGIYLYYADGFSTKRARVYNNMVAVNSTNTSPKVGIYMYRVEHIDLVHNSVHVYGSVTSRDWGVEVNQGQGFYFRNNAFINTAGGYSIYSNRNLNVSDYNNLYSSGNNLAYYNGIRSNLAAWRTATSRDANSISAVPTFTNDSNLHTTTVNMNGAATPISWVTDDIDGEARSTTAPDIGADEFSTVAIDAQLLPVVQLQCAGNNSVKVNVKNAGTQTITSAKINWAVSSNGGAFIPQTKASFTGSIASGATNQVTLGSFNFQNGNVYDIRATVDSINNAIDSNKVNDTALVNNMRPALSGTYDVGVGGDFLTLAAADSALDQGGMCGPVVLEIIQGSYNESVVMGGYAGQSATNSLTIRPDSANTAAVNWYNSSIPLRLNNASYTTVIGLNITAVNSSNAVRIDGSAHHLTFKENTFTGRSSIGGQSIYSTVLMVTTSIDTVRNIVFEENTFKKGSMSFYSSGNSNNRNRGLVFKNNTLTSFGNIALNTNFFDSLSITGNTITSTAGAGAYLVSIHNSNDFEFRKNKLDNTLTTNGGIGLYLTNVRGTSSKRAVISNNFIAGKMNSSSFVAGLSNCAYVNFYFNSISLIGTSQSSYALQLTNGNNNSFINNNVVNKAGGYAIYVNGTNEYANANYNNLYTTATTRFGYYKGAFRTSLSVWRTASSRDMNSVSGDPQYKSASDLHALGLVSNNAGLSISGFTTDIDGETRGASPDIGADEYTSSPDDAGIDSVANELFCSGTSNVSATLTNYGTDTLKQVTVNWAVSKNGGSFVSQTPLNWTGSLPTAQSLVIAIGTYNISPDTSYQIRAYTSAPNAKTDGYAGNDSAISANRKPAMSGVYVVAQSGVRDYSTVQNAVSDLSARGVCGATTIRVKDGVYSGSVIIPSVEGASATNSILIESDTSNTKRARLESGYYTVQITGASHITIKGFEIASTGKSPVYVSNANQYVTIQDNHVLNTTKRAYGQVSLNSGVTVWNTSSSPNFRVSIVDNYIDGGYMGISYLNTVYADSGLIQGNHITNFKQVGIVSTYDHHLVVRENDILDSTFIQGNRGIESSYCGIDFMNNRVVIHSDFGIGVYLRYSQDTTNARKTVSNNAITMVRERSNGNTNWGMSLWYADNQNIYFNSIWIVGPNNGASRGITITNSSNAVLRNNSVVNASGGYAMWAAASNTISSSNYNNFYSSGGNQIYGFGTNYTSVSAWNSGTGHDANSTSANANYMTAYEMRPNHIALDSTGTPITGFNTDIEGVTRGARPDMGAYEFNTRRDDAGVVAIKSKKICNGTQSVVLAVKNFGGDTLKTARVNWAISHNGGSYNAQTPYNWTGILPPGEVDSNVVVGTFNFTGGDYKLRTFTSIPNAKMDELPDNDSLHGSILVKLSGTYTLGDTASDFRTWNSFADAINAAGVCGAVTLKAMPKLYNESFELNAVEGLSNTFDLTILPDTGNGKVVLEDTLPVVRLNSMSYTTIRGVEVRNTGAQSAVLLEGENQYITLDSNVLVGGQNGSNNFEESVVLLNSGSGNRSHSIQLNGNTIKNGSYGVYLKGASFFAPDHGIEINGNRIQNFYAGGVYAFASDSLTIDSNVIQSKLVNAGNGVHGIYLNHADYFQITKNRISLVGEAIAATGITALNSDGSTNRSSLMLNNFVHAEGGHGISLSNSDQVNVYYNSVHITKGKYIAGHAVRSNSSSAVNFTNNSFANLAGGYVYYNYSGFSSNYNNLYTTGQLLSNNNVQSLAMWQSNTSQDANSVSADPIYLSKADLHANQTLMDSSATVLGSFNEDIDGETRDGSFPDMGADEFDLIKNVGIVEVLRPTQFRARKWTSTQFSGNDTIEVVVRNFGPDVMDIPIAVEFNGRLIQDTLFGTLTAGRLDTFRFAQTVNLDTVGTYNLRVYTAMPNDQYIENDTLNTEIVTLENAQAKLPFEEDFEGVKDTVLFENYLGLWDLEEWDFETNGGRLQTKSGKKSGGEQAITLDRSPNGPVKANELTLTLNMSRYDLQDSVYLDFDFIDHRDERHKGDSVWVRGSDTSAWVGVYDLWRNRRTNRTKEVRNIEVTSALVSANQNFSSSFQVRFGQEDNQRLPGDGRTFDNIKLWAVLPYDLAVSNAVAEYRQVPSDMANNRFQATVTNLGYNQADSVKLNAQVLTAFNDELLGSLMRDQDSTASLTDSMHVRVAGVYTAELFASFNRTEKCPENDSAQVNFSITDTVLARDDNVVDSTFGFSGSTGQMGTILEVFETDTITSVSFYLNFPTIGDTVQAHIYTYNNQVGNRELSTEPMVITSNAARWYTAPIKCLQTLKPGKYLVAVEQTGSYLTLGITRNNYMQGVSWINTGSAWNSLEDTLGGYLFNIHANFGEYDLPNIFAPKATCINSSSFALKTNKPGGQWSGTGVKNDSIFDPALAGYGTHVVRYSLQAANGCFDTNEVEILVDSIPTVSFVNPADLCDNDQLTALTGGTPAGGLYFGNGVTANRVNPAVLGAGTHTLNYTYARPVSGCADTASAQINIKAAPNVSFASVDDFCVNENPKALTQGNPVGGIYSGNGISNDSIFDPQAVGVGVYTIQYAFTAANACSDSATQLVTVNDTPSVNLGADTNLCPNQVLRLSASSIGTYLWSTGDTSEHLSVNTAGTYWHKTTNTHGCSNTDTIVVTFEKVCIGLAELESQGTLKYYPNPSTGMFTLELKEVSGPIQLTVRNVSGQVIRTYEWTSSSDIVEQIDLRDQARGIYFFDLQTPLGRSLERVTISR